MPLTDAPLQDDPAGLDLLEHLPIPVAAVDHTGAITFINQRAIELSGYTLAEVPTLTVWRELAFPDPAYRLAVTSRWDTAVAAVLAKGGGEIEPFDLRIVSRWGLVRDATIFGLARAHGFLALFVDHTERNRSEAARLLSEQRFRDVADAAGDYVWECGLDHRYTWVSDKVRDIFGLEPGEMLGRHPSEFMPEGEYATVLGQLTTLREPGGGFRALEHRSVHRSGEVFWQQVTGIAVRDARQAVIAFRGTGRDITLRKKIETERDRLESQVHEAQKLQALGTLAGGVAHEFNNLLAVILGHSALARADARLGEAARDNVLAIEEAAREARNLVSQLLAIGRQQPRSLVRLALAQVVHEALRLLEPGLPEGVTLAHELEGAPLEVSGDPAQLRQVLLNLGMNALQSMLGRRGRVRVSLFAAVVDDGMATDAAGSRPRDLRPGRYGCVEVTDEGCGMDSATQARIFEPFFTTKPFGQGTGLGLSVADGIVHSHGGALLVRSEAQRGSTFVVYLPLIDA